MVKLSGPGCYAFMRGDEWLYIGSTTDLSARPKKRDKAEQNRYTAILQADKTKIFRCDSITKAQQLEEHLIRKHRPVHNIRKPIAEPDLARTAKIIQDIEDEIWAIRAARMANQAIEPAL